MNYLTIQFPWSNISPHGNFGYLIVYFARCGHCKALAPHYEDAAKELKGTLPLFEINCDEDRSLCDKAGIQGFPTLKVYANGVHTEDYQGDRTKGNFLYYLICTCRGHC